MGDATSNAVKLTAKLVLVIECVNVSSAYAQERIALRNSMNTPITVLVQAERQTGPTQLRLLVDQTRDYDLKWPGLYAMQVIPDDVPDSGYFLGSHDLRAVAQALRGRPLDLKGDFQLYYAPATGILYRDLRERVVVFFDVPRSDPGHVTRITSSKLEDYMQELTGGRVTNEPRPTPTNAVITIIVPPDARVFIDGKRTTSTGALRSYYTPNLVQNETYKYHLKVEWTRNGHTCEVEREVEFKAGELTRHYFKLPIPEPPAPDWQKTR